MMQSLIASAQRPSGMLHHAAGCSAAPARHQGLAQFFRAGITTCASSSQPASTSISDASANSSGVRAGIASKKPSKQKRQLSTVEQQLKAPVSVVPGVGPKYEKLLACHSISTVEQLMALHMETHQRNADATRSYLQVTVGIKNQAYLRSIMAYLQQKEPELAQSGDASSWLNPKVTLSVEGNISSGKSTFLKILGRTGLMKTKMQVVQEPVEKWQNCATGKNGSNKVNLLMEFYKDPQKFAYRFQNYVFLTRVVQERESYTAAELFRVLERSVFSDRMVFVRAMHAARQMNDTDMAIYDSWFDPVLSTLPTLVPNGFIYLRAEPETCHTRLKKRAREEESSVPLDYLTTLHENHEDWLYNGGASADDSKYLMVGPTGQALHHSSLMEGPGGVLPHQVAQGSLYPGLSFHLSDMALSDSMQAQRLIGAAAVPRLPSSLQGHVRLMDMTGKEHIHPLLHTVPALVLDCNSDLDVEQDQMYQADVASKVSSYCDYVRDYMSARAHAVKQQEEHVAQSRGPSVRLSGSMPSPRAGHTLQDNGLLMPAAESDVLRVRPATPFNGYTLQAGATTLYVDQRASLLAFPTANGAIANADTHTHEAPLPLPSTKGSPLTSQPESQAEPQTSQVDTWPVNDGRVDVGRLIMSNGSGQGAASRQLVGAK